jgi:hypothetical protein
VRKNGLIANLADEDIYIYCNEQDPNRGKFLSHAALAAFIIQPHEQHDPHPKLYECLFTKNLGPTVGTSFQFHCFLLGRYEREDGT